MILRAATAAWGKLRYLNLALLWIRTRTLLIFYKSLVGLPWNPGTCPNYILRWRYHFTACFTENLFSGASQNISTTILLLRSHHPDSHNIVVAEPWSLAIMLESHLQPCTVATPDMLLVIPKSQPQILQNNYTVI